MRFARNRGADHAHKTDDVLKQDSLNKRKRKGFRDIPKKE